MTINKFKIGHWIKMVGLAIAGTIGVILSGLFLVALFLGVTAGPVILVIWVIYKLFVN